MLFFVFELQPVWGDQGWSQKKIEHSGETYILKTRKTPHESCAQST